MFYSEQLNSLMFEIGSGTTQVCVKGGKSPDKAEFVVITFNPLSRALEVGAEVSDADESTEKGFGLMIHNIEGLEVLEKALAACRKKITTEET